MGRGEGSDSEIDPAGAPGPGGGGLRVSEQGPYPIIGQLQETLMISLAENIEVDT